MEKDDPSHMYHILSYLQDNREEIERINTIVSKNLQNLEVHFCNLTMSKVQLKNKKKSSLQQRSTPGLRVITNNY